MNSSPASSMYPYAPAIICMDALYTSDVMSKRSAKARFCFLKTCAWPQNDFTCSGLIFVVDLCCCPWSFQSPFSVTLPLDGNGKHGAQFTEMCSMFWPLRLDFWERLFCFFFCFFLLPSILLLPPHLILLHVYPMRKLHTELVTRWQCDCFSLRRWVTYAFSHDLSPFCMTQVSPWRQNAWLASGYCL